MASSPDDGTDRQNHDAIQAGKRVKGRGKNGFCLEPE
jgi:hypothetical protein